MVVLSSLYIVLIVYILIIFIIKIKKIKKIIIILKKIIKKIYKFLYIFNIFFKDIKTGENVLRNNYINFFMICGFIQRNLYYVKGAFILGYTQRKYFLDGFRSVLKLLLYKCKIFGEELKINFLNLINLRNLLIKI
jgi:hypothetical protein